MKRAFFWMVAASLAAGCGTTQPAKYFALQPLPEVLEKPLPDNCGEGLLVGVGPVVLSKYLNRAQIAVVDKTPEIYYSDGHRWAYPLQENVMSVLIQNLQSLLGSCRIVPFPWVKEVAAEYWVVVQFMRFDGVPGGQATLDAQWRVATPTRDDLKVVKSNLLKAPVAGKSYEDLVHAQSDLLGQLSRQIAADIQALEGTKDHQP